MNTTIGERLRGALELRGMDPAGLIRRTGLSKGTIYNILNDLTQQEKIRADTVDRIARVLGVRADWLAHGAGAMEPGETAGDDGQWSDILGYAQAVGLGDPVECQEYQEAHKLKFRSDSLARKRLIPGQLGVVYGSGDSMLPRIKTGDAILFDRTDTKPRDGHLYVIHSDGVGGTEYSVKRAEVLDDLVFFRADNPEGDHNWRKPRRMDDPRRPVYVVGRVRWIGSWEG